MLLYCASVHTLVSRYVSTFSVNSSDYHFQAYNVGIDGLGGELRGLYEGDDARRVVVPEGTSKRDVGDMLGGCHFVVGYPYSLDPGNGGGRNNNGREKRVVKGFGGWLEELFLAVF